MTIIVETRRLSLRELTTGDASFIWELVNDADWLRHIGDRGVRTTDDAVAYITSGPMASYVANGFGLWCVELRTTSTPIGLCGLLRRDWLDGPDIGFALLPEFRGAGYAFEAARAVLTHAMDALGVERVSAIVSPGNGASLALLARLGMQRQSTVRPPGEERDVLLYAIGAGLE